MDQEVINLKKEYNSYLKRHHKACVMLDDNNVPISKRESWLPEYKRILYHLNRILNELDERKVEYTAEEALAGFEVEGL
jgi:hypothetical protein